MTHNMLHSILQKENITFQTITKSSAGFTCQVFFVDDKYVVKLVSDIAKREQLAKEISVYQNHGQLAFIPSFVASGTFESTDYLIIKKVSGQSLYSVWHALNKQKREEVCAQIVAILKVLHNQPYNFLPNTAPNYWASHMQTCLASSVALLQNNGFDASSLLHIRGNIAPTIFAEQQLCLLHNDMHFDNLIYNGKTLTLIDFDRVLVGSKDYELLILLGMCNNPKKFASEQTERLVNLSDYADIAPYIKKHYSSMFRFKYLTERLFVYSLLYELENAFESSNATIINTLLAQATAFTRSFQAK